MARDTVLDRFKGHMQTQGDMPALYSQATPGASWRPLTWRQYWEQASGFAAGLLALGYATGEAVAIMGNNCPQWVIADVGALLARAVPAGTAPFMRGSLSLPHGAWLSTPRVVSPRAWRTRGCSERSTSSWTKTSKT